MRTPTQRSLLTLALLCSAGVASAQEMSGSVSASSGGGGGGDRAAGIGLGAETMVTGGISYAIQPLSAAAFVYDATKWRIHGLLGLNSQGDTDAFLGGRFFFVLHTGTASDFSVGGGLGFFLDEGPGDDATHILLEGAAQLRAFVVPNVAIGASLGLGFFIIDEEGNSLGGDDAFVAGGQLLGTGGIWYFFD